MPLSKLLKSALGTCPFCRQKAGIISREHPDCRRIHQAGWQEMVQLAAQAAGSPDFDENQLRLTIWTLRILSGISEGICNTMVQSGGEFLYIGVGGR